MSTSSKSIRSWPQLVAIVVILIYCATFLVNCPDWAPSGVQKYVRSTHNWVYRAIYKGINKFADTKPPPEFATALYLLFMAGLFPACIARIAGRKLSDLGWRRPNRLALRYFVVALVISAPFLIWMVNSPHIAAPYLNQLKRLGGVLFCVFYVINMFTEHLLLHGIVLGLSHPAGRWPQPIPVAHAETGRIAVLRWLGMAESIGEGVGKWLGLAPGCFIPMLYSALLFGMVHLGKDTRELVLAFPGGLAQAYIAYRSNSWYTPFIIHLATASMALVMMLGMR